MFFSLGNLHRYLVHCAAFEYPEYSVLDTNIDTVTYAYVDFYLPQYYGTKP